MITMLNLHRHDLLFLSPDGKQYAWNHRISPSLEDNALREYVFSLPGIYRNQSDCSSPSLTAIGFSLPVRRDHSRKRIASEVPTVEIVKAVSPWEITSCANSLPGKFGDAVQRLKKIASSYNLQFGVLGSASLQLLTNLPYLHEDSDLDVIIGASSPDTLCFFYEQLVQVQSTYNVRIDAEVMVNHNCYFKLHEFSRKQKTILIKGIDTPSLWYYQKLSDTLAALP